MQVTVTVDDAGALISELGVGALLRVEHAGSPTGTWTEFATAALVAGTSTYTVADTDELVSSNTWYRVRHSTAAGTSLTDYGAAFRPTGSRHDIVPLELARWHCKVRDPQDTRDDEWLATTITAVSSTMERLTGRWLSDRGRQVRYVHGSPDPRSLAVQLGVRTLHELAVANGDQPSDGTGTYTAIDRAAVFLDPPEEVRPSEGGPATRLALSSRPARLLPRRGVRASVRVDAEWGHLWTPEPLVLMGLTVIGRAFLAKSSGGADYAISGPDGMKVLRFFSPDDLEVLGNTWGELKVRPGG